MKRMKKWSLIVVAMSGLMYACDREDQLEIDNDEELEATSEILDAEGSSDEDVALLDVTLQNLSSSASARTKELCAAISVDSVAQVITLDFGEGCVGPYGRTRSGQLIITFGGEFDDDLANRIITYDNYTVNDRQITGSIELRNINKSEAGNYTWTRTLKDYTVTYANGQSKTINGSTTRELIEGYGDHDISNNVVLVTGNYETTTTFGTSYTYTIVEPVRLDYPCWTTGGMLRISGVVEISRDNANRVRNKMIDYGDECDNNYTVVINSERITVGS
ncbi:hypothetical protein SAMN04488028_101371 [Reichenbachiella agariperforans]|uniref:Uncharacterized protein n=1 Tax=Reichenbachiella agariperforans TaxID=156994 RepID=A0A1M6JYH5_REIAG|nr:hypothetical protein [Reichenbachiella agariperforans]SHJ51735.1 hypothetical protein SAMN04488028_101371 [Reichenbachiella agariperforans]